MNSNENINLVEPVDQNLNNIEVNENADRAHIEANQIEHVAVVEQPIVQNESDSHQSENIENIELPLQILNQHNHLVNVNYEAPLPNENENIYEDRVNMVNIVEVPRVNTDPNIHTSHRRPYNKKNKGQCGVNIPCLNKGAAIACLVINIILPGFGTMFSGCLPRVFSSSDPEQDNTTEVKRSCIFFWLGILHLFCTLIICVGWVLSLSYGCQLVEMANYPDEDQQENAEQRELELNANENNDNGDNNENRNGDIINEHVNNVEFVPNELHQL